MNIKEILKKYNELRSVYDMPFVQFLKSNLAGEQITEDQFKTLVGLSEQSS